MDGVRNTIHGWAPHGGEAVYLTAALWAIVVSLLIYRRCKKTACTHCLSPVWVAEVVAFSGPMAIYGLLLLAPLDTDMYRTLLEDRMVLAVAAVYGLAHAINDLRGVAARARNQAASKGP